MVGHGVDEGAERADMVIKTFEDAVARHGRPERVMDDKGAAFWSWRGISRFTALLTEMGIDQVIAEKKEWNGKIEEREDVAIHLGGILQRTRSPNSFGVLASSEL